MALATMMSEAARFGADPVQAFDLAHLVALMEADLIAAQAGAQGLRCLIDHRAPLASVVDQMTLTRSQAEVQAVCFRLQSRSHLLGVMETNYQLREALLRLAERSAEVMILTQGGELTTLGQWALMIDSALTRDSERLVALYNRMNRSPAGAYSASGSDLAINRLRLAELLGFDGLVENTYDALQSPDLAMEFASELMILSQSLARLVDDLTRWGRAESAILAWPTCETASSEAVWAGQGLPEFHATRGLAAQAMALLTGLVLVERGPTGAGLGERPPYETGLFDLVREIATRQPLLARLIDECEVDHARAERLARQNWGGTSDLSRLFMRENGLGLSHARALARDVAQEARRRGMALAELTAADVAALAQAASETDVAPDQAQLDCVFDPKSFIDRRETQGGAGPEAMAGGLRSAHARIRLGRSRLADREGAVGAALARCLQAAEALVAAQSGR